MSGFDIAHEIESQDSPFDPLALFLTDLVEQHRPAVEDALLAVRDAAEGHAGEFERQKARDFAEFAIAIESLIAHVHPTSAR